MKKFILLAIVLFVISGCAQTTFQATGSCVEGESVILSVTDGNPNTLDSALLTANFAGLESGAYTAAQATAFLDTLEVFLEGDVTYIDYLEFLNLQVASAQKYVGLATILLGSQVSSIAATGGSNYIYDCDKELILAEINSQRALVSIYQ